MYCLLNIHEESHKRGPDKAACLFIYLFTYLAFDELNLSQAGDDGGAARGWWKGFCKTA